MREPLTQIASAVTLKHVEDKLSAWSSSTLAKVQSGESSGLPPPHAVRPLQADVRGRGRGRGRPRGRPPGRIKCEETLSTHSQRQKDNSRKLDEPEDEENDQADAEDDDDDSDGEGDHRIEKLVRGMRYGGRRWVRPHILASALLRFHVHAMERSFLSKLH